MNKGYSICLNKWALDKDIQNELGLLMIISSLTAQEGYCYASNKYLAEKFDVSEVTISRKIKKLEQKKYININYKKRGAEIISREITLNLDEEDLNEDDEINENNEKDNSRLTEMITDDYQTCKPTIIKNVKDNNISINNINNNKHTIYISEKFQNINLTKKELKELEKEHGIEIVERAIEILSLYKKQKPIKSEKNYNDYIALQRWAIPQAKKDSLEEQILKNQLDKSYSDLKISKQKEIYYRSKKENVLKIKNPHKQRNFEKLEELYD